MVLCSALSSSYRLSFFLFVFDFLIFTWSFDLRHGTFFSIYRLISNWRKTTTYNLIKIWVTFLKFSWEKERDRKKNADTKSARSFQFLIEVVPIFVYFSFDLIILFSSCFLSVLSITTFNRIILLNYLQYLIRALFIYILFIFFVFISLKFIRGKHFI